MSDETEARLMKTLAENSVDAFNRIYELYIRRLRAFVGNIVSDSDDVEDIMQETFFNLWRYREKIDPDKPLPTLLFTIAHRLTLNFLRRKRLADTSIDLYRFIPETITNSDNRWYSNGGGKLLCFIVLRLEQIRV